MTRVQSMPSCHVPGSSAQNTMSSRSNWSISSSKPKIISYGIAFLGFRNTKVEEQGQLGSELFGLRRGKKAAASAIGPQFLKVGAGPGRFAELFDYPEERTGLVWCYGCGRSAFMIGEEGFQIIGCHVLQGSCQEDQEPFSFQRSNGVPDPHVLFDAFVHPSRIKPPPRSEASDST